MGRTGLGSVKDQCLLPFVLKTEIHFIIHRYSIYLQYKADMVDVGQYVCWLFGIECLYRTYRQYVPEVLMFVSCDRSVYYKDH